MTTGHASPHPIYAAVRSVALRRAATALTVLVLSGCGGGDSVPKAAEFDVNTSPPRTAQALRTLLTAQADALEKGDGACRSLRLLAEKLEFFADRARTLALDDAGYRALNSAGDSCEKDPKNAADVLRALAAGKTPPADTGKNVSEPRDGYNPVKTAAEVTALLTKLKAAIGPPHLTDEPTRLAACKTLAAFTQDMKNRTDEGSVLVIGDYALLNLEAASGLGECEQDPNRASSHLQNVISFRARIMRG